MSFAQFDEALSLAWSAGAAVAGSSLTCESALRRGPTSGPIHRRMLWHAGALAREPLVARQTKAVCLSPHFLFSISISLLMRVRMAGIFTNGRELISGSWASCISATDQVRPMVALPLCANPSFHRKEPDRKAAILRRAVTVLCLGL